MKVKLRVSSSVIGFREKAEQVWGLKRYSSLRDTFKPCVFFGMYHIGDYTHYLFHRGKKIIFWCGSDILNLNSFWAKRLKGAKHYCENEVEQDVLFKLGIKAVVRPSFLDDIDRFPITYKWQDRPQVFLSAHAGREDEYGWGLIKRIAPQLPGIDFHLYGAGEARGEGNIIWHGKVSDEQFYRETQEYHCGLRPNKFDGASEIMIKSILNGGYPITRIKYSEVDHYETEEELVELLKGLKNKTKPNYRARQFWINNLNNYAEF